MSLKNTKILVVDDDINLLEVIGMRLETAGYDVTTVSKEKDAVSAVKEIVFDISIIDLQLDEGDGISLMEEIHLINADLPVIILTAYGSIESAVEAMSKGAFTYLTKPFDHRELLLQIERALETRKLSTEIQRLKGLLEEKYNNDNIVAKSEKMQKVLGLVSHIARTDSTVCVTGESGTGKELVARAIHDGSERKDLPFVAVNCAAIPEALLESELFGYEKGAFTGAVQKREGLFVRAHEGTIFLDEIGDMPHSLQSKILRVLQERKFYSLGSKNPVEVDVRVIVATNKNLQEEVREGRFREDLFYRIYVIPVILPPLRDKIDDIPHLANHFIQKLNKKMKKEIKGLSPMAMQKLMLYDWPGNVRELENIIEYAMALTQENIISDNLILQTGNAAQEKIQSLKEAKSSFEKDYIIQLLELTSGNVSKASELAGKYRADFYNLLKKYNIKPETFKKVSL